MSFGYYALPALVASYPLRFNYNIGRGLDEANYWMDYYRNTGINPRYRFRSGYYDYWKYFAKVI